MELSVAASPQPYGVRQATAADAGRLASVGATLFAQTYATRNTPADMQAYLNRAFGDDVQRRELADPANRSWLAEAADATPIGYAQVKLGSGPPGHDIPRAAELTRIYADQGWHGRGVGAALLGACVDAAREWGATAIWLGVWKENPRGIAFYQKHGFQIVGEQTFLLGSDRQHDWVMLRALDQ